ncbi:hypothetical protein [Paludisphaera rhizosphaerae]|uniref:hypothetical protein n=1 Tax=Paludisphaera rhizosphaerae TaxID=2711216 RepID=UPI0013EA5E93|nr:hypothetical protein [Paludisphaera rhizosphaerae]
MAVDSAATYIDDEIPALDQLRPLEEIGKLLGVGPQAIHRWRLDPLVPLRAWKVGRRWCSTVDETRDFIRRRTLAASSSSNTPAPPAPTHTARRRKQIDAAVAKAKAMGC